MRGDWCYVRVDITFQEIRIITHFPKRDAMNALSISTNSPYVSAVLAQQQVLGDQMQVQTDQVQLRQDQSQLANDSAKAATVQQQAQSIQQNQVHQAQQAGLGHITQAAPVAQSSSKAAPTTSSVPSTPTVNTSGQTVGKIINVVA